MKNYLVGGLLFATSFTFIFSSVSAQTFSYASNGPAVSSTSVSSTEKTLEGLEKLFKTDQVGASSKKIISAAPCLSLTKNLSKGSENSEVLALQQFLFDGGYLTIKSNGYFGAGTVTAVKKFQIANGMSPVGSVGIGTRTAIKKRSCAGDLAAQRISEGFQKMLKAAQEERASSTQTTAEKNKQDIVSGASLDAEIVKNNFEFKNLNIDILSFNKLINLGGKVAFWFIDKEKGVGRIFYDGKEIGKEYSQVGEPADINGKIAFTATKNKKLVIVYDGKEYGEEYDTARSPANIGGKLTYLAAKNNVFFIVSDGKKVASDAYYGFNEIDGNLAYDVVNENSIFIMYDGKEIGKQYDGAANPISINGKLAYRAIERKGKKTFIVYDGKEYGKDYGFAVNPFWLNGKLGYIASTQEKGYFIVYDGKEITGDYSLSSEKMVRIVNGKIAYLANRKINGVVDPYYKSVIFYDGKYIGENYDKVFDFIDVNGKLVYIAKKGKESFLVTEK